MSLLTIQQAFELALQHHKAGKLAEAETIYRQILGVQPNHVLALSNLGEACRALRKFDEAAACQKRALHLDPANAQTWLNLGNVHLDRREFEDAIAAYRRTLELQPGLTLAYFNLGNAFRDQGRFDQAIVSYRQFLLSNPCDPGAYLNLGAALASHGDLDGAIAAYQRALELRPGNAVTHSNLGDALCHCGQVEKGIKSVRRAVEMQPACAWIHSNLIYTLHFLPELEDQALAAEQHVWSQRFEAPPERNIAGHTNIRHAERRLRIGYVSPDFRQHVVGRNIFPLYQRHDHVQFEIESYAGTTKQDTLTQEFRARSDKWCNTIGVTDEALASEIQQNGVDILVDLTQHMAGNRLPMFAGKPAPIQVSFAGYPESTGLEAIGYRISDRWMEQGGVLNSDGLFVKANSREEVYLIDSFWCYDPCGLEMNVNDLPAHEAREVTFGSLNNFCKVNGPLLKLWARVLKAVRNSRLMLLSHEGSHRQRTRQFLEAEGVEPHRVEFVSPRPRQEYLELYHRLDIALDTFPYNGHTTSLDALWMGVPVVSLCGERPVSRAGLSQLNHLGLPELVAFTEDQFVKIASQLANDIPRLAELRAMLRSRMEKSVLMDATHFTRQIETCYRSMWRRWCESRKT